MSFRRVTEAPWVAIDFLNEGKRPVDIDYASVTAPRSSFITVEVTAKDGTVRVVDGVYAGQGSHSWWTGAHGKLLKRGLEPGERLRVVGDGEFAFRWDWQHE